MLAIAVDFLLEKSFSGRFEDGDSKLEPEWPPHPARLFRALTSAAFDSPLLQRKSETQTALAWLESQSTPEIRASEASDTKAYGVFVPVNDEATGQKAYELLSMRPRKERRFPATVPKSSTVYFVWPKAEPSGEQLATLGEIMRHVPYLGSSRSLVGMWFTEDVPQDLPCWRPDENGDARVRTTATGSLRALMEKSEKFHKTGLKAHRPDAGIWTAYSSSANEENPMATSNYGEMLVAVLPDAMHSLEATLPLCKKFKEAVIKYACEIFGSDKAPDYLTGHTAGSLGVPAKRLHVCAVPLAHVGSDYADGRVLGLGILLPRGLSGEERRNCYQVIQRIDHLILPTGKPIQVSPAGLEEPRKALSLATWLGASRTWASVTPLVFHRFPKKPGDEAALIEQACEFAGLPRPRVALAESTSQLRGVPVSSKFRARESVDGRAQRFHRHVYLEFPMPVSGPLLLGAGQSYGYGFCRPVSRREFRIGGE